MLDILQKLCYNGVTPPGGEALGCELGVYSEA